MVTVASVNRAIAKEFPDLHIEFVRGNGYQYFSQLDETCNDRSYIPSIYGYCYVNQIPSVDVVIKHIRDELAFYDEHGYHNI